MDTNQQLIDFLSKYVTENRFDLFNKIIKNRTSYITVVLEDIYQSQNASAVLRTCDCFGVQDIHIIENRNQFDVNPEVSLGSSKWLSLHRYNEKEDNTQSAITKLKADGYRIVATTPHSNDVNLEEFDLSAGKCAFVFGTELKGISETVKANADVFLKIPMYGFTESFNISVSAAIILHHLTHQLRSLDLHWQLNDIERNELMVQWLKVSIKESDFLIDSFLNERSS